MGLRVFRLVKTHRWWENGISKEGKEALHPFLHTLALCNSGRDDESSKFGGDTGDQTRLIKIFSREI